MENLTTLKLTVDSEKGVALVRFDRPAKRNAFSQVMIGELVSTLAHLDALDTIRAVVVTGGPEGPFCGTFCNSPHTSRDRFQSWAPENHVWRGAQQAYPRRWILCPQLVFLGFTSFFLCLSTCICTLIIVGAAHGS